MTKIWTKEEIVNNILKKDNWLYRSILAIYAFQTDSEKVSEITKENNACGFNSLDAKILSSFADQIIRRGYLSDKQKVIARKKMPKYSRQLLAIANSPES